MRLVKIVNNTTGLLWSRHTPPVSWSWNIFERVSTLFGTVMNGSLKLSHSNLVNYRHPNWETLKKTLHHQNPVLAINQGFTFTLYCVLLCWFVTLQKYLLISNFLKFNFFTHFHYITESHRIQFPFLVKSYSDRSEGMLLYRCVQYCRPLLLQCNRGFTIL